MTEDLDIRDKWLGIKYLKNNFKPKLHECADKHGNKIGPKQRAEATAEYLEAVQWRPHPNDNDIVDPNRYEPPKQRDGAPKSRNTRQNVYNINDFTVPEVAAFLNKAKKRKACGPDQIPMDFNVFER